jgi:hypothetical protein
MIIPGTVFGDIQQVARSGKQLAVRRARAEARVDQFESDLARAVAQIDKDEIRARLIAMLRMAWKRTNALGDESSVYLAALDRLTGADTL